MVWVRGHVKRPAQSELVDIGFVIEHISPQLTQGRGFQRRYTGMRQPGTAAGQRQASDGEQDGLSKHCRRFR